MAAPAFLAPHRDEPRDHADHTSGYMRAKESQKDRGV